MFGDTSIRKLQYPRFFFVILSLGCWGKSDYNMFGNKKPKPGTRVLNIDGRPVEVTIDDKGNISADFSMTVNGQKYDLPIKTTIAEITQSTENEANPSSCEKEPECTEIMLPVAGFFEEYILGKGAGEVGDRAWSAYLRAKGRGYNYFVISREDFEYLQNKIKNL